MALVWMVDAVEPNSEGDVLRVRWGLVDTALNRWQAGAPRVVEVIEVVDLIVGGTQVFTRMPAGSPGPTLKVIPAKVGVGIETVALDHDNLTVADLERL